MSKKSQTWKMDRVTFRQSLLLLQFFAVTTTSNTKPMFAFEVMAKGYDV